MVFLAQKSFEKYYVHINYKKRNVEISTKKPTKKLKSGFTKIPVEIKKAKAMFP